MNAERNVTKANQFLEQSEKGKRELTPMVPGQKHIHQRKHE